MDPSRPLRTLLRSQTIPTTITTTLPTLCLPHYQLISQNSQQSLLLTLQPQRRPHFLIHPPLLAIRPLSSSHFHECLTLLSWVLWPCHLHGQTRRHFSRANLVISRNF